MSDTVKIVHIIIGLGVGGAERFLSRLIGSHSDDPRFDHTVVSLTTLGVIGKELEDSGTTVYCLGLTSSIGLFKLLPRLYKILRKINPNVVHCWMYHSDLIGGLVAKLLGIKKILWGVRNTSLEQGGTRTKRLLQKTCAFLSGVIPDKIICVAYSAYESHKKIGYNESRMIVINNGYEINRFQYSNEARAHIRSGFCLDESLILIGSVGRFSPAKDHFGFIEAAADAYKKNQSLRFMMIGRDVNQENSALYQSIIEAGIDHVCMLIGEVSNINDFMSAMDIFCLHSETEGFPNVLGEAMCVGLPCIATDVGDAGYLIKSTGKLVPPKNISALSGAMLSMAELEASARCALGVEARKRIVEHFSLDSSVRKFTEVYCA